MSNGGGATLTRQGFPMFAMSTLLIVIFGIIAFSKSAFKEETDANGESNTSFKLIQDISIFIFTFLLINGLSRVIRNPKLVGNNITKTTRLRGGGKLTINIFLLIILGIFSYDDKLYNTDTESDNKKRNLKLICKFLSIYIGVYLVAKQGYQEIFKKNNGGQGPLDRYGVIGVYFMIALLIIYFRFIDKKILDKDNSLYKNFLEYGLLFGLFAIGLMMFITKNDMQNSNNGGSMNKIII